MLIANRTIGVLLDAFAGMLLRREGSAADADLSIHDQAVLSILTRGSQPGRESVSFPRRRLDWVRAMMDHIASLTDPAAIREARLLNRRHRRVRSGGG